MSLKLTKGSWQEDYQFNFSKLFRKAVISVNFRNSVKSLEVDKTVVIIHLLSYQFQVALSMFSFWIIISGSSGDIVFSPTQSPQFRT